jgi:glycerophosphoryl diester phosphodiesterase
MRTTTRAPENRLLELPYAHRGLHGPGVPENSLASFAAAVRAGVGIELDVHLLDDGSVAVFHDLTLERLCGLAEPLTAQPRERLATLRLAGTSEHVPVLDEALEVVAGAVPLQIELKQPLDTQRRPALCQAVHTALRRYPGPVLVMSFDPWMLRWFWRHAPEVPRVQLAASLRVPEAAEAARAMGVPRWKAWALEHLVVGLISRPDVVGYDVRALPHHAPRRARRRGRPVLTGIVRDEQELATALAHADGVASEDLPSQEVLAALRGR